MLILFEIKIATQWSFNKLIPSGDTAFPWITITSTIYSTVCSGPFLPQLGTEYSIGNAVSYIYFYFILFKK